MRHCLALIHVNDRFFTKPIFNSPEEPKLYLFGSLRRMGMKWLDTCLHCPDSTWEGEFCRMAKSHPRVKACVKNHNLGFEVPDLPGAAKRTCLPDFIVQVDDGHEDPLQRVGEIKGFRGDDARLKKTAMETCGTPGVNNLRSYGRGDCQEITDIYRVEEDCHHHIKAST